MFTHMISKKDDDDDEDEDNDDDDVFVVEFEHSREKSAQISFVPICGNIPILSNFFTHIKYI